MGERRCRRKPHALSLLFSRPWGGAPWSPRWKYRQFGGGARSEPSRAESPLPEPTAGLQGAGCGPQMPPPALLHGHGDHQWYSGQPWGGPCPQSKPRWTSPINPINVSIPSSSGVSFQWKVGVGMIKGTLVPSWINEDFSQQSPPIPVVDLAILLCVAHRGPKGIWTWTLGKMVSNNSLPSGRNLRPV